MSKPASLSAGLIAKKGEATPVSAVSQPATQVTDPLRPPTMTPVPAMPKGTTDTIAVTVRLDPDRYQALKIYGAKNRVSNQDILVAALDLYLKNRV
jgi:hypothetical protein